MGKKKGKKKPEPIVLVLDDTARESLQLAMQRLGESFIKDGHERLAKFHAQKTPEDITGDSYDASSEHREATENIIFGEKLARQFDDDLRYVFGDDIVTLRTPEEQAEIDAKKTKGKKGKSTKGSKAKSNGHTETPRASVASSDAPTDAGDNDCGE